MREGHYYRGRAGQLEYSPARTYQGGGQCKPLSPERVKGLVMTYLEAPERTGWKLGKLREDESQMSYVAEILRKDGTVAERVLVNQYTGMFRSFSEK